jgi:hypothetical protein
MSRLIPWHFFRSLKPILVEPSRSGSCTNTLCTASSPFLVVTASSPRISHYESAHSPIWLLPRPPLNNSSVLDDCDAPFDLANRCLAGAIQ